MLNNAATLSTPFDAASRGTLKSTRERSSGSRNDLSALYICYWSLRDPLCQSQSLAYLRILAAGGHRFALITFEQSQYALKGAEKEAEKRRLAAEGIEWYPLRYHKRFSLLAKAWDCFCGVVVGVVVTLRRRPQVIHSRSTIPAAMALVIAKVCRRKFLYDADSALSEEYADIGHWKKSGLAYRVASGCERTARKHSDAMVVLTEQLRNQFLIEEGCGAAINVIPCCVDVSRYCFDATRRIEKRKELNLSEEPLFIYVGKIGSWYLVDETFELFRTAVERLGHARLLVLSPDSKTAFDLIAARHNVDKKYYEVRSATRSEVWEWLSAADVGLALITQLKSKRGSSPIKAGEYLAVGLPVVITASIGDYSDIIHRDRLGVVIGEHSQRGYNAVVDRLTELWAEGEALRMRCRVAAEANVSLTKVGGVRYAQVYRDLAESQVDKRSYRRSTRANIQVEK